MVANTDLDGSRSEHDQAIEQNEGAPLRLLR